MVQRSWRRSGGHAPFLSSSQHHGRGQVGAGVVLLTAAALGATLQRAEQSKDGVQASSVQRGRVRRGGGDGLTGDMGGTPHGVQAPAGPVPATMCHECARAVLKWRRQGHCASAK